ncbi:hypothetical protein RFM98_24150, partial [Mesorhizobium sp. VK9D]|uniref:hypothetical protein n=1 Tax=Mesorhizobium australafricanum TaxID=3072311 RepID=UPI002A24D4AA
PRMRPIGRRAFLTVAPDTKLLSSINTQKQNPAEIDGVCQQSEAGQFAPLFCCRRAARFGRHAF